LDPGLGSGSQLCEPRLARLRLRLGVFEPMDNIRNNNNNKSITKLLIVTIQTSKQFQKRVNILNNNIRNKTAIPFIISFYRILGITFSCLSVREKRSFQIFGYIYAFVATFGFIFITRIEDILNIYSKGTLSIKIIDFEFISKLTFETFKQKRFLQLS
jgi:hypothetical protein